MRYALFVMCYDYALSLYDCYALSILLSISSALFLLYSFSNIVTQDEFYTRERLLTALGEETKHAWTIITPYCIHPNLLHRFRCHQSDFRPRFAFVSVLSFTLKIHVSLIQGGRDIVLPSYRAAISALFRIRTNSC